MLNRLYDETTLSSTSWGLNQPNFILGRKFRWQPVEETRKELLKPDFREKRKLGQSKKEARSTQKRSFADFVTQRANAVRGVSGNKTGDENESSYKPESSDKLDLTDISLPSSSDSPSEFLTFRLIDRNVKSRIDSNLETIDTESIRFIDDNDESRPGTSYNTESTDTKNRYKQIRKNIRSRHRTVQRRSRASDVHIHSIAPDPKAIASGPNIKAPCPLCGSADGFVTWNGIEIWARGMQEYDDEFLRDLEAWVKSRE